MLFAHPQLTVLYNSLFLKVGITDALDAFLPEGVVSASTNNVGSGQSDGGHMNNNNGVLIVGSGSEMDIAGRRGGWGSSSDSSSSSASYSKQAGEPENDSNVVIVRDIGDGDSRGDESTSNLPRVPPPAVVSMSKAAAAEEERQPQHKELQFDQLVEPVLGGTTNNVVMATRQWPQRRPSKVTARGRQTHQPSLSSSQQRQKQAGPRRRRLPSDSAAGGQALEDRDEDIVEDGLVVSSFLSGGYAECGAAEAIARDGNGGAGVGGRPSVTALRVQPAGGPTNSVVMAPFHGPVPASSAIGSTITGVPPTCVATGSTALTSGGAGDSVGGRARGGQHDSFLELAAVVGIPVKQQPQSKGFRQRPRPARGKQPNQHQQPQPPMRDNPVDVIAPISAAAVPMMTWDSVAGTAPTARGGENDDVGGNAADDLAVSTGTAAAAAAFSGGAETVEGHGDRGEVRPFYYSSDQRHGPRREPTAIAVARKDHHVQPPPPLQLDVVPVPSNSSEVANVDTTTQATTIPSGRDAAGGYNMGISGTGMVLPWKNSKKQGSIPLAATGAGGAGANRRRLRREQTRAADVSAGVGGSVAGWGWGSGNGGGNGGSGGSGGNVDSRASEVGTTHAIGAVTERGSIDAANTSAPNQPPVAPQEWGDRPHRGAASGAGEKTLRGGGVGDRNAGSAAGAALGYSSNASAAAADLERMVVVASGVGSGGGSGSGGGGGGAQSHSIERWRAAGGGLASLKARMGVRYQRHPAVAAGGGRSFTDGDRDADRAEGGIVAL